MRLAPRPTRRRGSTLVETALVIGVFLLVLFGIFEYCRFLMVLHVANNAARDGARYAAVNVNCPSDQIAATKTKILTYTKDRMGGIDRQIQGCQIAVYSCDSSGFASSPPKVVPKSNPSGSTVDPFAAYSSSNKTADWNAATFTERIAVTVKGTYRPIAPLSIDIGRLKLSIIPDNIPVEVTAVMGSEG
jgi:Flp pilus assembly protein TadG